MNLNHIHLSVRDLSAAVIWFENVLQVKPGFRSELMATFSFGAMTLIFDAPRNDTAATVGFESDDCDLDFRRVVEGGAIALEQPKNKSYGVRAAYFQGPGTLKFEIEGPLANN